MLFLTAPLVPLVLLLAADASAAPLFRSTTQPLLHIATELEVGLKARHKAAYGSESPLKSAVLSRPSLLDAETEIFAQVDLSRSRSLRRSFSRYRRGHERRDTSQEGTPGFVEVATRLFHTNLVKSVAGLVFSAPFGQGPLETLEVGTSATQSSEFFMARSPNALNDTGDAQIVQLQISLFDSAQLTTRTYCATFPTVPPCNLSLMPCGLLDGMSQDFAYNASSGQLQPLFQAQPSAVEGQKMIGVDKLAMKPLVHDLLIAQFDEQAVPSPLSASAASATASSISSDASIAFGASTVLPSRMQMIASPSTSASVSASDLPTATPKPPEMSLFFVAKSELSAESSTSSVPSASASSSLQSTALSASQTLMPTMANLAIKPESRLGSPSASDSAITAVDDGSTMSVSATPSVWSISMPTIKAFARSTSADDAQSLSQSASAANSSALKADAACATTVTCPV